MNRFIKFFHEMLHPHCEECIAEREELKFCPSCDTLKFELARLREENNKLIEAVLDKPKSDERPVETDNLKPIFPNRHIPWNVKRQSLEAEDRKRAEAMRNAAKPDSEIIKEKTIGELTTTKIEEELGIENA